MNTRRQEKPPVSELEIYRAMAQAMDGWEEWIDADGNTIFVSPSCQRFTGLPPETLTAKPESLLACIHPEDRQGFEQARTRLLPEPPGEEKPSEFRLIGEGTPRWFTITRLAGEPEELAWHGVRIRYHDIHAQKLAETALDHEHRAVQALINTPADVFTLFDRQGTILAANAFMAKGMRRPLEELLGKNAFSIYHPSRREARRAQFERVLASKQPVRFDDLNASGEAMYDSIIYPVLDERGEVAQVVILARDVTERYHLIQALSRARDELEARVAERTAEVRQAEDRWRKNAAHAEAVSRVASRLNSHLDLDKLLETICEESLAMLPGFSLAIIMLYDEASDLLIPRAIAGGAVTLDQVPTILRSKHEQVLGNNNAQVIIHDTRQNPLTQGLVLVNLINACTVIGQPLHSDNQLLGYLGLVSVHTPRPIDEDDTRLLQGLAEHACIAVKNAQMYQLSCTTQDRLRALSDRLIAVREDERRTLAYALHDDFGQSLTALSLNLEMAAREMRLAKQTHSREFRDAPTSGSYETATPKGAETWEQNGLQIIDGLRGQVGALLQKARDLSQDLRPGVLDDLGLFPALLDYSERFTRKTNIVVHVRQSGALRRFSPQIETTCYRIAQEALTNVARHAQTNEAHLLLWCDDELLGLRVEDHGIGFQSAERESFTGMESMREWAALCGGSLEIETDEGQGAIVTLEIPLSAGKSGEENSNDD